MRQPPPGLPDVSVIIVSWNVRDRLADCLDSLRLDELRASGLNVEVIVVDSGSSDGSAEMVKARFPMARLLQQTDNIGFSAGNNIGLKAAAGRALFLLNPDTLVHGDALAQMVGYLDTHPDVGAVGPHTRNPDGTTQSTHRRFPTFATALFESTWLQPFAPRHVLDRYYAADIPTDSVADVDWVQGSALMIRCATYEQIGGLDEQYVMFSEEMDWCRRAKAAGWRVVYMGTAAITHYGGQSTDQATARRHIHFQQSKLRYFAKYHGPLAAMLLRIFLIVSYVQQWAAESIKGLLGHKRSLRRERTALYRQVIQALARRQTLRG